MTDPFENLLRPGDAAPDFTLATVQNDRAVSLSDYRGKSGLFLGLFRGMFCPFCRRAIAQMAANSEKLRPLGIESLAVVATELDNARLYFKFHPLRLPLAVDPALTTHRSYRVPHPEPTPDLMQAVTAIRINPTGELPQPLPVPEAAQALEKLDQYQMTERDKKDAESQITQLKGQFFIDRGGIIRWVNIECAREGFAGLGKFPTADELVAAAQTLR